MDRVCLHLIAQLLVGVVELALYGHGEFLILFDRNWEILNLLNHKADKETETERERARERERGREGGREVEIKRIRENEWLFCVLSRATPERLKLVPHGESMRLLISVTVKLLAQSRTVHTFFAMPALSLPLLLRALADVRVQGRIVTVRIDR